MGTSELFLVSLVVLLLVLLVLLILFWILRHNRNKNLTVLKISAGQPTRVLTIRTEQDHAQEMLDHLLDRVFLQVEDRPQSGEENGEELRSDSESIPGVSTSAVFTRRALSSLHDKLSKWVTFAIPPQDTPAPCSAPPSPPPPPPPPPSSPVSQDQSDNLDPQQSNASQHAFLPSQSSCYSSPNEQQHDEPHL